MGMKQPSLRPGKLVWDRTSENQTVSSKSRDSRQTTRQTWINLGTSWENGGNTYISHIFGGSPGIPGSLTWRQGLLQFLCLLFVCDDQGIKVSAASNFKLHIILIFLDLDSYQRDQLVITWCHRREMAAQFTCFILMQEVVLVIVTTNSVLPPLRQRTRSLGDLNIWK